MAVMMAAQKNSELKRTEVFIKKPTKHYKTRPITATLEHPLILDIKFLKKLDMTTFTKKGLMALSKFCGISLINKTDTKKKLNKCAKTIQYSKKQLGTECKNLNQIADYNKREFRTKRKLGKQTGKGKPRIRFKIAKEDSSPDEDSSDVVCKGENKIKSLPRTPNPRTNEQQQQQQQQEKKGNVNCVPNDTIENIIPEPCKTCSRSEHPERLHSHPKMLTKLSSQERRETNEKNLEDRFRKVLTTKKSELSTKEEAKKNISAKENEKKSLQHCSSCDGKTPYLSKSGSKSPSNSSSATELSPPDSANKNKSKTVRNSFTTSTCSTKSKNEHLKKPESNTSVDQKEKLTISAEEAMKFVTGCYICGEQLSPKSRMKHEKTCIAEWRAQNVSEDKRKAEPKRPDFRFTASGDLDYEGTFDSIWANHMDSLVPCKKCGRKFFSDRIQRHESCCNNLPVNFKYKH